MINQTLIHAEISLNLSSIFFAYKTCAFKNSLVNKTDNNICHPHYILMLGIFQIMLKLKKHLLSLNRRTKYL